MRITDGRETFYQWDINVSITSENFILGDEVHFSNRKSVKALPVAVKELNGKLIADVPNELLQVAMDITAYHYTKSGESEFTVRKATFKVDRRLKPEDYVYTETELITVEDYVDKALEEAKERGELAYTCKTYADYAEMVTDINSKDSDVFAEGQDIRILTLDVPDLWVAYVDRDYVEYTYTNDNAIIEALNANGFIKIGYYRLGALETQKVDLLDYVKKDDYATRTTPGLVKTSAVHGLDITALGELYIAQATTDDIAAKKNTKKPITSVNLDYAVKTGITTNAIGLTEEEKAAARKWLGAIKKPAIDPGGYNVLPIVDYKGDDGQLRIYATPLQYAIPQYKAGGRLAANAPIDDLDCVNKKYVDDALGDIASALDELHTYAQSLIGGNA